MGGYHRRWMSNEQARQPFYIQIEPINMTHQYVKAIGGEVSLQSDQIQQSNSIKRNKVAFRSSFCEFCEFGQEEEWTVSLRLNLAQLEKH